MRAEDAITRALGLCKTNPKPIDPASMINTQQSFTAFFFHLVREFLPENIFEWGPGHSTNVFLAANDKVRVFSYESIQKWADQFYAELQRKNASWINRIDFKVIPCGEPVDEEYVKTIYSDSFFDIVLIDGIDRGRCASEAERIVRPGGIIMCHDTDFPGMFDMVNDKLSDNVYYFGEHVNGSKTSIWIRK